MGARSTPTPPVPSAPRTGISALSSTGNSNINCDATDFCVLWVGQDYNAAFLSGPHAFSSPVRDHDHDGHDHHDGTTTTTTTATDHDHDGTDHHDHRDDDHDHDGTDAPPRRHRPRDHDDVDRPTHDDHDVGTDHHHDHADATTTTTTAGTTTTTTRHRRPRRRRVRAPPPHRLPVGRPRDAGASQRDDGGRAGLGPRVGLLGSARLYRSPAVPPLAGGLRVPHERGRIAGTTADP